MSDLAALLEQTVDRARGLGFVVVEAVLWWSVPERRFDAVHVSLDGRWNLWLDATIAELADDARTAAINAAIDRVTSEPFTKAE